MTHDTETDAIWIGIKAPDLGTFERLAEQALETIPLPLAAYTVGLGIRIEDFPDDEMLADLGLESPFDLLGLYQGVSLPHQGSGYTAHAPNLVFLFRRPILDLWSEGEETLGHIIRHVLIHEIGHHFGFSDADMDRIEKSAGN